MKSKLVVAGLCALALSFGAASAPAQVTGLYYKEVEKDGRVYVFNTPERYKQFQEGGEIGTAITLVGKAEGGKTLVAENETAIDLYFFKHDELEGYDRPTPKPYAPPFDVSWKDGKTSIKSKNAQLDISNRIQIRFTSEDLDAASSNQPERDSFRVRRMKTKFEGWAYDKNLTYEMQVNFADSANVLEDAQVNYDFSKGKKAIMLKAGQFKVPFGRQELTSSGSQQFVDRAAVSNTFARGRDIGVQLWGTPNDGKLDWRVGVFNGNGRTVSRNDNDDLQLDARLQWAPFGDPKYSESDFEGSDKFLFAVAAEYEANTREVAAVVTPPALAHQNEQTLTGFDVVAKYKGFSLFGEMFQRENDRNSGFSDFDDSGYTLQAGYFVVPQKFEVALRLSELDPNDDKDHDQRTENGVAVNWFWNKHSRKLQADFRELEDKGKHTKDREIRLQYQLIF